MASAGGYIQVAPEQAPNSEHGTNAVSSTVFYLPGTTIDIDPKVEVMDLGDELRGGFFQTPNDGAASFQPDGSMESRLYPATLGLLLLMACGTVNTTAGNGVITDPEGVAIPSGAYRHVFGWKTGEIPQTAQFIWSPPEGGFWKAKGVGVDELAFKRDKSAWLVTPKLLGLYADMIVDPSLTPSYEAVGPWRAGQMVLTWLSGSAITEDFDWSIKNGLKTESQMSDNSLYPDSIIYDQKLPVLGGTIPKRSLDADDWAALIAGTQFSAKMHWTHSQDAATDYKHQLWVECKGAQYQSGKPDAIKNERRNKASYDWAARQDSVSGTWGTLTLVNSTPAYATYA